MSGLSPEIDYCRATVKAWEKLRLIYNAVLLVAGGIVLWRTVALQGSVMANPNYMTGSGPPPYPFAHPATLVIAAVLFGIVANLCYCLGPYCEFVLAARGVPLTGRRIRLFLFAMGLLGSLGLVGLAWGLAEVAADLIVFTVP